MLVKKTDLSICGYSHIVKVIRDEKIDLLHINREVANGTGQRKIRTMVKFDITDGKIQDFKVIELGDRA